MNSFSIKRFWKTFCWIMSVDFRNLMIWASGFTLGIFLGELLFLMFNNIGGVSEGWITSTANFFVVFVIIGFGICTSNIFVGFGKKTNREAFLMMPATNLEKFMAAMVYASLVGFLTIFVAFCLGDTLRMVFRSVVYGDAWLSTIPELLIDFTPDAVLSPHSLGYRLISLVFTGTMIVWLHSLYTLGGTLLRKYAFVIASIVFIFSMVCLSYLWKVYGFSIFQTNYEHGELVFEEAGIMAYILSVVFVILSVFNYWASFRIFKNFELITNKWVNYDFHK